MVKPKIPLPFPARGNTTPLPLLFVSGLGIGFLVGALVNMILLLSTGTPSLARVLIFLVVGAVLVLTSTVIYTLRLRKSSKR